MVVTIVNFSEKNRRLSREDRFRKKATVKKIQIIGYGKESGARPSPPSVRPRPNPFNSCNGGIMWTLLFLKLFGKLIF